MNRGGSGISLAGYVVEQSYEGWARTCDGSTDTTVVVLKSPVVPGGLMNANSRLEIITEWEFPSSANAKFLQTDWGGSNVSGPSYTTAAGVSLRIHVINLNSLSVQRVQNAAVFATTGAYTALTKDTAGNVTVDIKCKWGGNVAVGTETIRLFGYSIIHWPGRP